MTLARTVQKSKKTRDIALITLMLHSGLRISEVCAASVTDIVLRDRSGEITVRSGKGNKWREVPLNATVRFALNEWLQERGEKEGPLFLSQKGGGLTPRAVVHMLAKYAKQAGLDEVTPHSLRHTFCKSLIDAGESLNRVALLAGHSNLNTTAKYI